MSTTLTAFQYLAWVAHSNTATALTDPTVCNTLTPPYGQLFPFRVEASIPNQCTIEKPVSDIDLGTRKPVGESDVSGTTEILVRCHSKDSNYNIGLEPSKTATSLGKANSPKLALQSAWPTNSSSTAATAATGATTA